MTEVTEIPRDHDPFPAIGVSRDAKSIPRYDELPATLLDLLDHCRGQLAGFKIPQSVTVVDSALPPNAGGKLLKGKLREQVQLGDALR